MKVNHGFLPGLLIGILVVAGCGTSGDSDTPAENESPRIRKASRLLSPLTNSRYVLGDTVEFELDSEESVDSVRLDYGQESILYLSDRFSWQAINARTGRQRIRLTVYMGELVEVHYPTLTFLSDKAPEQYTYQVMAKWPHDQSAYTQGLFFKDDTLFESTGQNGQSRLSKVNLTTAAPYQSVALEADYFGEGSTWWQDKIIYLTWTTKVGFVYTPDLKPSGSFRYSHQGWGITTWGDTLIVSDGTEVLRFLNPQDFSEFDQLQVYDHEGKVVNLNELEMINGLLYANVYQTDRVVVIDPNTGQIIREIDLSGLLTASERQGADVLNGIAYNPSDQKIYVTGKLWPALFEVTFLSEN